MKVVICEVSINSHVTYVVSLAKIFASDTDNQVDVVIKDSELSNLGELKENANIRVHPVRNEENGLQVLQDLNKTAIDKWIFPTLEPTNKSSYKTIQRLFQMQLNGGFCFAVHNVDLWFSRNRFFEYFHILTRKGPLKLKYYRLKGHFYAGIVKEMTRVVKSSEGFYIVISDNIKKELRQFVADIDTRVLPFCVFDQNYFNKLKGGGSSVLRVVIPGFVSNIRRDYLGFLRRFEELISDDLKDKIEIDLLGGLRPSEQGDLVQAQALEMQKKGYRIVVHKEYYLPMDVYDRTLAGCDLIAGILHVRQGGKSMYGLTKETGITYNMIKMAKPGFLPHDYACPQELSSSVIVYSDYDKLVKTLLEFVTTSAAMNKVKENALENSLKFTPEKVYREQIAGL